MKIAIDIDGTLNDNIPYINKRVKKFAKREKIKLSYNPKEYDFCKKYNYSQEIDNKFWEEEIWNYATGIKQKKNASKIVKKLKNEGNEIIILTARYMADRKDENGQRMRSCVENWLKQNKIYYDKIVYVGENNSKLKAFLNNKCEILIDDKVEHLQEISQHKLAICMIEPYNENVKYNNNVVKCKTWKQVYKAIKNYEKVRNESIPNS